MTHTEPLAAMAADGMVPLYSSESADDLYSVALALADAGISTFEVTLRLPQSLSAFQELLQRAAADDLPLMIGAGTVMDVVTAEASIEAGARFVFSPVISDDVARRCAAAGVVHIPGCATPTEIKAALQLGCTTVKLFPADAIGGPGFLRAVRSIFAGLECIPSGGIAPEAHSIRPWFEAGAPAVALGSQLFRGMPISSPELTSRFKSAMAEVAKARAEPTR